MKLKRILLAGGSGFIGRALAKALVARGYEVIILTRTPRHDTGFREVEWSGAHIGEWIQHLNGAEAIVNLTGRNVNCPHTKENLLEILESRVNSVRAIANSYPHIKKVPRVWVQASAVGFYGDTGETLCDEDSPVGDDTLADICKQWEDAFNSADTPKTRHVCLRIGFVLGNDGGTLPVLTKLTKWFLGGTAGKGKQYISWIHIADLVQMFIAAIERDDLTGKYNAVGASPMTNAEFMTELRHALRRPWSPPVPKFAIRLGAKKMKSEPSLVLASQCCAPIRFLEAGFEYEFPKLRPALENLRRG
ncbi:MAG: TIGR01777 family oxidoreductase [Limisphaerales bacterium]